MTQAGEILLGLLREAWGALAGALLAFALLATLSQVLRASSASVLGAGYWVREATSAGVALIALALFAFLGVPVIIGTAHSSMPSGGGCGPIEELGALAAGLIAALAAVRILRALVTAVAVAALGGGSPLSSAMLEAGEAVLGMAMASVAASVGVQFLGSC